jgi:uncharacterized protein (DUF58 family)
MPGALLDRDFLEKLERLTLHWQKSFAGLVGGHNRSQFAGSGQEFLDHRSFHHGDDLRAVNWRAYMRLEKLFLKMFQVEPRVPVRLLLDSSASMATHGGAKFDCARRLAGALCYVGLVRLDAIELQAFTSRLNRRIVSSGGRHRFFGVMDGLSALRAHGATDMLASVREFIGAGARRGLVIVVSDFLDPNAERALQYLTDYGNELMLLQIWADEDRTPPWSGELELEDAETGAALTLNFDDSARQRYTESFDAFGNTLQTLAHRSGGRYAGIAASQPIEEVIFGDLIRARGVE